MFLTWVYIFGQGYQRSSTNKSKSAVEKSISKSAISKDSEVFPESGMHPPISNFGKTVPE
jgi:hypothetical protein